MRALGIVYRELPNDPMLAWKFLERREPGFAPPGRKMKDESEEQPESVIEDWPTAGDLRRVKDFKVVQIDGEKRRRRVPRSCHTTRQLGHAPNG